jgi:hypothetical protein
VKPYCEITRDGVVERLPMTWRESVFKGGAQNGCYNNTDRAWHGFWVVDTQDAEIEETVTLCSIAGARDGAIKRGGETISWEIVGSPSIA